MTTPDGVQCPHCPRLLSGRESQWAAHARTHTYLHAGARHWVNTEPWWVWTYELVNPAEDGPKLWVERLPGRPVNYAVHRTVGERTETLKLAADGKAKALKEAAGLLRIADWTPMLSLQARQAA